LDKPKLIYHHLPLRSALGQLEANALLYELRFGMDDEIENFSLSPYPLSLASLYLTLLWVKLKSPKLNGGGGRGGVWGTTTNLVVDATTVRVKGLIQ
jgi:hypothetical protein